MPSVAAEVPLDRQLETYRRELTAYCYRMLGSSDDAQDAVQDTLLRAWRAFETLEGRAALRSWLYKIATNVCLTMLDSRRRRALPMDLESPSPASARLGAQLAEEVWIRPIADSTVIDPAGDPADVAMSRETMRLAFIAALQHLPPRQRAVLILRDVLRWQAAEVADLLDATVVSVNGLLRRARMTLASRDVTATQPAPRSPRDQDLLARYVEAFERLDIDTLVALLRHDAVFSMPPYALWLEGIDSIRQWMLVNACLSKRLVPLEVNGSAGFALYEEAEPGGVFTAFGIQVLERSEDRIAAIHTFLEPQLFPSFGLPKELPQPNSTAS
jgi:RNA polymerase sigma-70 factor (ECF subfamily)